MSSPKISVIIPVYNVEKYLETCMESVINQKFKDIEIICVNDCSTDNSLSILNKFAEKDQRIKIIDKLNNEGLLMARKSGVEIANGEYIVFLDSDDYISDELCEFIADFTQKKQPDIIQFTVDIEDNTCGSQNSQWLKAALQPENVVLNGENIIKEAYINRSYVTSVVGKAFKTSICKKAYKVIPDEHCYVGEDIFTYFIIAYYSSKYIGVKTPGYYIYRYGLGVENTERVSLAKFEQYCKMSNWIKYAKEFLESNLTSKSTEVAYSKMEQRMFEDCCKIYKDRISEEDRETAAEIIVKYWDINDTTQSVMTDKLGISMEKFVYQTKVPVYTKYALAFNDNNKPKVSVIIPVYNVEQYLKECLDSVINQSLEDVEVICVNDGSPDNSLQIIEEYARKDNRITVISKKNGGLSSARNSGIECARGEYIYFLDSDDFIKENSLEKLYNISKNENLDILYFGVENYFENEEIKKHDIKEDTYYQRKQFFDKAVSGEVLFERFLKEDMFICCVPFQFFRTEFLKDTGIKFKPGMLHEDELFSPRIIIEAEKAMIIEDRLYMRRIREDSIMTTEYTYRNFIGYFVAYTTLLSNLIYSDEYSSTTNSAIVAYAQKQYNTSRRIYRQLFLTVLL